MKNEKRFGGGKIGRAEEKYWKGFGAVERLEGGREILEGQRFWHGAKFRRRDQRQVVFG